jgi:hypothetical protein
VKFLHKNGNGKSNSKYLKPVMVTVKHNGENGNGNGHSRFTVFLPVSFIIYHYRYISTPQQVN